MKRSSNLSLILISLPTIILSIIGIVNMSGMSSDKIECVQVQDKIIVSYVPLESSGYRAGIQIGDTVISVNDKSFKSLNEFRGEIVERIGAGKIAIYGVKRNNDILNLPLKMEFYYSRNFIFFLALLTFVFIFSSMIFYVTFPSESQSSLLVYIFYQMVTLINIYSLVSFNNIPLYLILIITSSFAPAAIIYFSQSLKREIKKVIVLFPAVFSFIIMLIWGFFYIRFALSLSQESVTILMNAVKIIQMLISIMIIYGIEEIIRSIYANIRESDKIYISYISSFLLLGYFPFIILYAIPVALGKKEILPVWMSISFSIIPLFGIIVFNNFFYKIVRRSD